MEGAIVYSMSIEKVPIVRFNDLPRTKKAVPECLASYTATHIDRLTGQPLSSRLPGFEA